MRPVRASRGVLGRLATAEPGLRRVALELDGEQVLFVLRDALLFAQCSCAQPMCGHVTRALTLLDADPEPPAPALRGSLPMRPSAAHVPGLLRESQAGLAPVSIAVASAKSQPSTRNELLAAAVEELVLATARAGVSSPDSVSVKAALEQLVAVVGDPLPLGLARFLGRFQEALAAGEVGRVARLLDGLAGFGAVLRAGLTGESSEQLQRAWLSHGDGAPESLSDVSLVEVAREWLHGLTRNSLERRYLVELASGAVYCEERRRGSPAISVGPCPRVVHVAYAQLDPATRPQHVRLLQYSVAAEPTAAQWEELASFGARAFSELLVRYTRELSDAPALAEPFVLVAPASIESDHGGVLCDAAGARLELSDDTGGSLLGTLRSLSADADVVWVAGRLRGTSRGITLRPTSLLVRGALGYALRRIT